VGGDSVGKFLAPHTGRQAGAIANAEAGTEYNPGIRQSREEAKGSRKREQDLGAWYAQLASDYQGAQDRGSAALQSVEDTTTKQLGEANAASSADQARLASQDESFATLVGGPKDTEGLAKIAQAGAAASRARVDQSKPVISEQANFTARLGSDKTAARLQGIEERRSEQRRRDKIKSEIAAQRKEKGSARVAAKEKIRESDRGYATELKKLRLARKEAKTAAQAAAADAALAQLKAGREARQDAIANQQAQERIGISRRNAGTAEKSQAATAKHYKQTGKGLTPTQQRAAHREQKSATITAANLYKAAKKPPSTPQSWAAFTQLVAAEEGIDATAAAKAVAKLRQGLAAKNRKGYANRAAAERAGKSVHR
jgi:hypothetical protein